MKKIYLFTFIFLMICICMFTKVKALDVITKEEERIFINGEFLDVPEKVILYENRLFAPVRFISEKMDSKVYWDDDKKETTITTKTKDTLKMTVNNKNIELNQEKFEMDVQPIIFQNRLYIPLRLVSELNHAKIEERNNEVQIFDVPMHIVQKRENLYDVASSNNVSTEDIVVRNQLKDEKIKVGQSLKVVIPYPIEQAKERLYILAKIIEAEAGGEPMLGKIAVGNVILNRVKSDEFPKQIKSVVFQNNQFTPIRNGVFERTIPSKESYEAAEKVLNGENVVEDALYFYNPNGTKSTFFQKLTVIKRIGNHVFLK